MANRQASPPANAEFLKGEIENIPLPDNSVDVIHLELRHQPLWR
jgi:ubiquinone/menaquinone biosynthesis C-methylase UbiE